MKIKRQTEKDFMATVVQFAKLNLWWVYHTFDSRRSAPGFPDLVLVRGGELVFAELKLDRGILSDEQVAWIRKLAEAGQTAFVWRPADWPEIERVLGRAAA